MCVCLCCVQNRCSPSTMVCLHCLAAAVREILPGQSHSLAVRLNRQAVLENRHLLFKVRYQLMITFAISLLFIYIVSLSSFSFLSSSVFVCLWAVLLKSTLPSTTASTRPRKARRFEVIRYKLQISLEYCIHKCVVQALI